MKRSIQPYMSSWIVVDMIAFKSTLWDRFLTNFSGQKHHIIVWYLQIVIVFSSLVGLVWRPLATMKTLHTTLHVVLHPRVADGTNVNTLASILDKFSCRKQHIIMWYCQILWVFKPNWSCLATYSQDENTPYNHTFRHTSGGSWLHKVITSGSIFDLFSGQKQHGFVGYFQMGRFFKPNWSCLTTYSHNETLHTTIHVVMHPNGGGCIKGNTLGSILDLFWVEKIILLWYSIIQA